jgi:uncharacterized protein YoxC
MTLLVALSVLLIVLLVAVLATLLIRVAALLGTVADTLAGVASRVRDVPAQTGRVATAIRRLNAELAGATTALELTVQRARRRGSS